MIFVGNLFKCMLRLTYFSISHKSPLLLLRNSWIFNFCYKEMKNSLCDDRPDHIPSVSKSVSGLPGQPNEVDLVLISKYQQSANLTTSAGQIKFFSA